jgi:tetratricopeptide (TPR) repeat protein
MKRINRSGIEFAECVSRSSARSAILHATFAAVSWFIFCSSSALADDDATALCNQAEKALAQKDLQTSINLADQSIKLHPSPVAFMLRAKASMELYKFADANKDASSAIELNPKLQPAYIVRALARKSLGDTAGGLADAKMAAELDPTNIYWLSVTAMMECEGKSYKDALQHYTQAIALLPTKPQSGGGTGKVNLDVSLFAGRAEANAMMGNFKESLSDYDRAIALNPATPRYFVNRGTVKDELGDHKGAISDYDEAIKLKPDDPVAYKLRSDSKNDLGDKAGAVSDLEKSSSLMK